VIEELEPPHGLYIVLEYINGGVMMKTKMSDNPKESPTYYAPHSNTFYTEEEASRIFR
jgi:hypothetical protein